MLRIRNFVPVIFFISMMALVFGQQEEKPGHDAWEPIVTAMRSGDAGGLAKFFSRMVDLGLPEKDHSYSKSQGEIVMKDFFRNSPPDTFELVQKGKTSDSQHFAICTYRSGARKYQVSINLHHNEGEYRITRIKFEKEE